MLGLASAGFIEMKGVEELGFVRALVVFVSATLSGAIAGLNYYLSRNWGRGLVALYVRFIVAAGIAGWLVAALGHLLGVLRENDIWQAGAFGAGVALLWAGLLHVGLTQRAG